MSGGSGSWGTGSWGTGGWGGVSLLELPSVPADELDAFSSDPGLDAGRIEPSDVDADIRLSGDWLFCLGHDLPGFTAPMQADEYVEVSQAMSFAGTTLLTFEPRTRPPSEAPPAGFSWQASLLIDGVPIETRPVDGSHVTDWATWSINTSKLAGGDHDLAFRLTLIGPAPDAPPASPYVEVEVPAFYVEAVALVAATGPMLLNARPDFNQGTTTGNPPPDNTAIDFDLVDFGVSGILQSSIHVIVDGSDAVIAGVAQSGWSVTITAPHSDTKHVHLVKTVPFASGALVHVSVAATTNAPVVLNPNPTTWSFTVADTVPPVLTAASARATKVVRVVWDEAVLAVTPTGSADALNASLYVLEPQIVIGGVVPAVTPTVVSVAQVSSTTFDVTTDIELSPGVSYSITADGVADLSGNLSDTSAIFVAFVPPAPAGRDFDLYRKLPRINRERDETQDLLRFIRCLQEVTDLLLYDIDRWNDILDVDVAPEAFLDAMLVDLGNPFPFELTEIDKRRLIRILVAIYKQKGTPDGLINAVRFFLGLEITIESFTSEGYLQLGVSQLGVDWILGPGTSFARYAFRVVAEVVLTDEQRSRIRTIADLIKPAHTHLIEIVEPSTPPVYDPMVLGVSLLGDDWILH